MSEAGPTLAAEAEELAKLSHYEITLFENGRLLEDMGLVCPICRRICKEATEVRGCGHLYCRECLEQFLARPPVDPTRGHRCPLDNSTPVAADTIVTLSSYTRTVENASVRCALWRESGTGCPWKGRRADLADHLNKECPRHRIFCTQCGVPMRRADKQRHLAEECAQRPTPCLHCGQRVRPSDQARHEESDCEACEVPCPNGCEEVRLILKRDVNAHRAVCPKERIRCTFATVGCSAEVERPRLREHTEAGLHEHLTLALRAVADLKEGQTQLQAQLTELQAAVAPSVGAAPHEWSLSRSPAYGVTLVAAGEETAGTLTRLSDRQAVNLSGSPGHLLGDTAIVSGRAGWRVGLFGIRAPEFDDIGVGITEATGELKYNGYRDPRTYAIETSREAKYAHVAGQERASGLKQRLQNADVVDVLLDLSASQHTLTFRVKRTGERCTFHIRRSAAGWRPYFYLGGRLNMIQVLRIHSPDQVATLLAERPGPDPRRLIMRIISTMAAAAAEEEEEEE